jgi:hypothetical protein
MVNMGYYRNVPYLHFQNLRREGTQLQRGGKANNVLGLAVSGKSLVMQGILQDLQQIVKILQ